MPYGCKDAFLPGRLECKTPCMGLRSQAPCLQQGVGDSEEASTSAHSTPMPAGMWAGARSGNPHLGVHAAVVHGLTSRQQQLQHAQQRARTARGGRPATSARQNRSAIRRGVRFQPTPRLWTGG
jgi:hypothetical protein